MSTRANRICSVPGCKVYFEKGNHVSFHRIPKNPKTRASWVKALKLGDDPSPFASICSKHFLPRDFFPKHNRVDIKRWVLFPHAVPSQFLPNSQTPPKMKRKEKKRREPEYVFEIEEPSDAKRRKEEAKKTSETRSEKKPEYFFEIEESSDTKRNKEEAKKTSEIRSEKKLEYVFEIEEPSDAKRIKEAAKETSETSEKQFEFVPGLKCWAPHCPNSEKMCSRVFRFPFDPTRRKKWVENCLQSEWNPPKDALICEIHFASDQWTSRDGYSEKLLKPDASPSVFFLPPLSIEDVKGEEKDGEADSVASTSSEGFVVAEDSPAKLPSSKSSLKRTSEEPKKERTTAELLEEIKLLKDELKLKEMILKLFFTDVVIEGLEAEMKNPNLKVVNDVELNFSIEEGGLNSLRRRNYPLSSIVKLNSWCRDSQARFGVFAELEDLVVLRVQELDPLDRLCSLSVEEVPLSGVKSKSKKLLGSPDMITVVMIRSLRGSWKLVVACEPHTATAKSSVQQALIEKSIDFVEDCGLRVLSVTTNSDSYRGMWESMGVEVTKNVPNQTASFYFNDHEIHVVPDVRHLLASLKAAVDCGVQLPLSLAEDEALPSQNVTTKHVRQLYDTEDSQKFFLPHLKTQDVKSSQFHSVDSAIRFFSSETAEALEDAASCEVISEDALTTAYFCRLVEKWYLLCNSSNPNDGITRDNKQSSLNFLKAFINIFQDVKIADDWSPVNAGLIMSSMSFCKIVEILLMQDGFGVVLLNRLSLDALDSVIEGIRAKPRNLSPLDFFDELRVVTMRQFISAEVEEPVVNSKTNDVTNDTTDRRKRQKSVDSVKDEETTDRPVTRAQRSRRPTFKAKHSV